MTKNSTSYERSSYEKFSAIVEEVALGIWKAIKDARGSCVSFTPRRIVEYAGEKGNIKPIKLTLVKYILEELAKKGILEKADKHYRICRYIGDPSNEETKNPLWELCKSVDTPEKVINLLKQLVE